MTIKLIPVTATQNESGSYAATDPDVFKLAQDFAQQEYGQSLSLYGIAETDRLWVVARVNKDGRPFAAVGIVGLEEERTWKMPVYKIAPSKYSTQARQEIHATLRTFFSDLDRRGDALSA